MCIIKGNAAEYSFREAKTAFPIPLWVALNIISNECANLGNGVSQGVLISKPACITANVLFLFFGCRIKMMKAKLFSHELEGPKFLVRNHWQLYCAFSLMLCFYSLTHSLGKLRFIVHHIYTALLSWRLWRSEAMV